MTSRLLKTAAMLLALPLQLAQAAPGGAAGTLQPLGAFPEERGAGHTVTRLDNGRIVILGQSPFGDDRPASLLEPALRNAAEGAVRPMRWDPKERSWRMLPAMADCASQLHLHTATALPGGKLLVAGGLCDPRIPDAARAPYAKAALWDEAAGKWQTVGALDGARLLHSASLLPDGTVVLAGGMRDRRSSRDEPVLDSVELYRAGALHAGPPLLAARARHSAVASQAGALLLAGGTGPEGRALGSVEILDAGAGAWRAGPPLRTPRHGHVAVLLDDGRVMVAGGYDREGRALASVEILDAGWQEWSEAAPLLAPLERAEALPLPNGDVLLMGGGRDGDRAFNLAMLWDKAGALWRPAGHLQPQRFGNVVRYRLLALPGRPDDVLAFDYRMAFLWRRAPDAAGLQPAYAARDNVASTVLKDGRIMLAGGSIARNGQGDGGNALDWAELYDPAKGTYALTGRMTRPRRISASIALDNGGVLVMSEPSAAERRLLSNFRHSEAWDPASGQWRAVAGLDLGVGDEGRLAGIGKLPDGRVVAVHEVYREKELSRYQAHLWDPRSGATVVHAIGSGIGNAAQAVIVGDGKVLLVARLSADGEHITWVWNPASGQLSKLQITSPREPLRQALALRSGDALAAYYGSYSGSESPLQRWQAASQSWRALPAPPEEALRKAMFGKLRELKDGSLLLSNLRLAPGSQAWVPLPLPPQEKSDLVETADGQLLAIAAAPPYVSRLDFGRQEWQVQQPYYLRPRYDWPAAVLALGDGRALVAGGPDTEGWPLATALQLWDPKTGAFSSGGTLSALYVRSLRLALLPSGQVMAAGIGREGTLLCEIGFPGERWGDCGSGLPARQAERLELDTLSNGHVALRPGGSEGYVYNEQARQWRVVAGADLGAIESEARGRVGRLPDGCGVKGLPFAFVDKDGRPLSVPRVVSGLVERNAAMAVLGDGTVLAVGYPDGHAELNGGFFHRKAGCAGFERQPEDELAMDGEVNPARDLPPVDLAPQPQDGSAIGRLLAAHYKWLLLAICVPMLLYAFRREAQRARRQSESKHAKRKPGPR